jgi:hypothetical protein
MSPSETVGERNAFNRDLPLLISSLGGDRNSPALFAPGLRLCAPAKNLPHGLICGAPARVLRRFVLGWPLKTSLVIGVMHEPF